MYVIQYFEKENLLKISVVIPVYNYAQYLNESIESVINQSHLVHELIIVDDGSTDNSSSIASSYPEVILHKQQHSGISAARNSGAKISTGDYLAFLDADDLWHVDKLTQQVQYLKENAIVKVVYTYIQQFFSQELSDNERAKYATPPEFQNGIFATSILVEKNVFEQVGEFNETLQSGEFIDWHARLSHLQYQWHVLPQVLAKRRIHNANTFQKNPEAINDYMKVVKAAIERRRRASGNDN